MGVGAKFYVLVSGCQYLVPRTQERVLYSITWVCCIERGRRFTSFFVIPSQRTLIQDAFSLARREVAIVTPLPGTTRDVLETALDIAGLPVRVSDTAGLRHTEDIVEKIGIAKAQKA